ncbi:group II intron maturase-specific domain-containing protein, partial [Bradyrhizobium sp. 31Argb]|uniref:group II intron maturase-specific domain-containing protein n=1 Tax=Bradyrhizobium sp. 31Argb TaxID=3141247 RepID=UPI00374A7E6C
VLPSATPIRFGIAAPILTVSSPVTSWVRQCALDDIARELNPIVRGWIAYYGQYMRSALYPMARYINQTIAIWLKRKYKRFRHRLGRARIFLEKIARENRRLFAHWQLGIGDKLA